jgi:glutamate dehydrogenase
MAIHDSKPRSWTDYDLGLVTEVTERSWAHIERVRSEAEARAVVRLFDLSGAAGLARLAGETAQDPIRLTRAYTRLGEALALDWAHAAANRLSPSDPWERMLVAGLARDFQELRLDFLRRGRGKPEALDRVEAWLERNAAAVARFRAMLARAQAAPAVTPAMLARVAGQARAVLGQDGSATMPR